MTSDGQDEDKKRKREEEKIEGGEEKKRKGEEEEKMEGGEDKKRKREEDSLEEDIKRKRIGPNARELEEEEPKEGPSTAITTSPKTPLSISRFVFHQVLGEGGFGKVVLASVPGRITYKAIKIIQKRGNNAASAQRERRVLLASRGCPFVSHLNAAVQSQSHYYFIMEYLSGGSLESLLKICGTLDNKFIRFYTAELICGLQFLHGHGIAHRDLKPANIMLDADGHIRIIDLGIAEDGLTASSKIYGQKGTFRYMAPEMHLDKPYTVAVDWWSLGIVVTIMASGPYPFSKSSLRKDVYKSIIRDEPQFSPWLNVDVKHLIVNLLQKDPEKRLGVSGNIRDQPLFGTICWEELETGRAQPPFTPFHHVLKLQHLDWPDCGPTSDPVSDFSFLSPSWSE